MTEFLSHNWLVLNVLIPLIGACFSVLSGSSTLSRRIMFCVTALLLTLLAFAPEINTNYMLGDWPAPYGIEYIFDEINFPLIIYLQLILLIFCLNIFHFRIEVERSISSKYRYLPYAVIMAAHAGFTGILVTGDIFNLYVFIEISSLASYALISLGRDKESVKGAFEYLIIGTIAATLILFGIGMLFSFTGHLNMKHIAKILSKGYDFRLVDMGILLFVIGALVKVALFPLHFWFINAYRSASGSILTYIASISGVVGFYIILRFIYSVIGLELFTTTGSFVIMNALGIISILAASICAYKSYSLRDVALFSAIVQVGYIALMIANKTPIDICQQYMIADGLMKFLLFYFISQIEFGAENINISSLEGLGHRYPFLGGIVTIGLISNIGLPFTIGFFNKMNLLYALTLSKNYIGFVAVILASIIGIEYNFRIIKTIYLGSREISMRIYFDIKWLVPMLVTISSFGLMIW